VRVGLAITPSDVLPVDEGISRAHQRLVDVAATLEHLSNVPPIAVYCLGLEGDFGSNGQQSL